MSELAGQTAPVIRRIPLYLIVYLALMGFSKKIESRLYVFHFQNDHSNRSVLWVFFCLGISCCLVTHHFTASVAQTVDGKREKTVNHVRWVEEYNFVRIIYCFSYILKKMVPFKDMVACCCLILGL